MVLGQLLIEGIPAYKTYSNLRDYDLVAVWPETNRSARIQVKSRWATDARHFLIKRFDCDFVVLVRLNRGYRLSRRNARSNSKDDPEFYILPTKDAQAKATTEFGERSFGTKANSIVTEETGI